MHSVKISDVITTQSTRAIGFSCFRPHPSPNRRKTIPASLTPLPHESWSRSCLPVPVLP